MGLIGTLDALKSLSLGDKSVNLFACFREGDSVMVGTTFKAIKTGTTIAKCLEARESSSPGIVQSGVKPVAAVEGGYFAGLLSSVQVNSTVYPPNPQFAIVQSTYICETFGDWGISGDDDFVEQPPRKKVMQKESHVGTMTELEATFQKGISVDQVYGFDDIEPMFGDDDMDAIAVHVDLSKEDDNMFVGRTFASREDFRIALSIYAISSVFCFKFTRYEKHYLVAECYDKKCCDWRVRAHQVVDNEEYEVRKAKLDHMCKVETRSRFGKHATSKVVAALLRAKYVKAFCGPRARDLPDSLLREHNVRTT